MEALLTAHEAAVSAAAAAARGGKADRLPHAASAAVALPTATPAVPVALFGTTHRLVRAAAVRLVRRHVTALGSAPLLPPPPPPPPLPLAEVARADDDTGGPPPPPTRPPRPPPTAAAVVAAAKAPVSAVAAPGGARSLRRVLTAVLDAPVLGDGPGRAALGELLAVGDAVRREPRAGRVAAGDSCSDGGGSGDGGPGAAGGGADEAEGRTL